MKRLIKPFLYATVVMLMSVSCKKEEPNLDCNDGTCCGSVQAGRFKFIQQVENAPADFSRNGGFNFSPEANTPMRDIIVCDGNCLGTLFA